MLSRRPDVDFATGTLGAPVDPISISIKSGPIWEGGHLVWFGMFDGEWKIFALAGAPFDSRPGCLSLPEAMKEYKRLLVDQGKRVAISEEEWGLAA